MKAPSKQHRSDVIRSILTIVAIVATFAVNAWSNIAPLNGLSIGAIANTLFQNVLIIPANYAFAIWGVIYLGLIAFGIYQVQPPQRTNPILRRVDWLLIGSCLVQALWVLLFLARQFWLSTVAMIGILLFLIAIYRQLWQPAASPVPSRVTRQERWFAHIPFSIYLGWISVATIVNVALALYNTNWQGFGIAPAVWTVIMMGIGAVLGILVAFRHRDIAYPLVIVWALIAIAVRHQNIPLIAATATGFAIAVAGVAAIVRFQSNRNSQQREA